MSYFSLSILIGEAGDILIRRALHKEYFSEVSVEEVDDKYYRLTRFPPAKQVYDITDTLIILTREGELILVDNHNPNGFTILGLPSLQRIWRSRYFMGLDNNNTLTYLNLGQYARLFSGLSVLNGYNPFWKIITEIPDVIEITEPYYQGWVTRMIIITTKGTLAGSIRDILSQNAQIIKDPTIKVIGNTYESARNGERYIKLHNEDIQIGNDIIDVAVFPVHTYLLNNEGKISIAGQPNTKYILLDATRFLIDIIEAGLYVEDIGGNLYLVPDPQSNIKELQPIDLPIVLSQPIKRGRMTKPALQEKIL